jgi:hypothetical protein
MKNQLSLLFLLLFLFNNCKKEEEPCVFNQVTPSQFKAYVPYKAGETILFKNKAGQVHTLNIVNYSIEEFVGIRLDCPFKQEKVKCDIKTNWQDTISATNNHLIEFYDWAITASTLVISTDPLIFQAANFGGPSAGENIETFDSFNFSGNIYNNVLLASCRSGNECNFIDSIGFVKGKGLAFYTLYGEQWVLEE